MAAARKIKDIAGHLIRDVERELNDKELLEGYDEQLWLLLLNRFLSISRVIT